MTNSDAPDSALSGWTVIGLRAAADQPALSRAVRSTGADFLALPALELLPAADVERARIALTLALDCSVCLFTSPAAVRFAHALLPLQNSQTRAIAVGSGSAAALQQCGVREVQAPSSDMSSEGVLSLPMLNPPPPRVGLVTAPGGRGELARVLTSRGAELAFAYVYERRAATLSPASRQALLEVQGPTAVLVSSADALRSVDQQLDELERAVWLKACAMCASARLVQEAQAIGFAAAIECGSTQASRQLEALHRYAKAKGFR